MERRRRHERRRSAGRRASDYVGGATPVTFLFAMCGALVVLYLFFAAVGGVDPSEKPGWTIAALVLAVLWLAHSWKRLLAGGGSPPGDRERRGF